MDPDSIRAEAERLQQSAEADRVKAEKYRNNAPAHDDDVKMQEDLSHAEKLEQEASDLESRATVMFTGADNNEKQQIEKEKAELKAKYEADMKELDKRENNIGKGFSLF